MPGRSIIAAALTLAIAAVTAATASAASNPPADPQASSPTGAVYQIPLQGGRADAAPRRGSESGGSRSSGTGQSGSSHRSGGLGGGGRSGSSGGGRGSGGSTQSGAGGSSSSGGAGGSSGSGGGGAGAAIAQSGSSLQDQGAGVPPNESLIHSENGFGASAAVPGTRGTAPGGASGHASESDIVPVPASSSVTGGPSAGTWLLIGVIAALGALFGLTASRALRRR